MKGGFISLTFRGTGYDTSYGARPIKRTIQRMILDPLAVKILNKEFGEGDSVEVDVEEDKIVFKI